MRKWEPSVESFLPELKPPLGRRCLLCLFRKRCWALFDRSFHLLWGVGQVSRNSRATEVQPLTSKPYMKEVLDSIKTAKSGLCARRSPWYPAKWKGCVSQKAKLLFLVGRSFWMISTLRRAARPAGREGRALRFSHPDRPECSGYLSVCHYWLERKMACWEKRLPDPFSCKIDSELTVLQCSWWNVNHCQLLFLPHTRHSVQGAERHQHRHLTQSETPWDLVPSVGIFSPKGVFSPVP